MERTSFWSRVGGWLRHSNRSTLGARVFQERNYAQTMNRNGRDTTSTFHENPLGGATGIIRGKATRRQRDEGLAKLGTVLDSLQKHFDTHEQRSGTIAESLEKLAAHLAPIPETSKAHSELLGAIRDGLEAHAARAKRIDESLSQLPQLADLQRETFVSIGRQLEVSRQTSERVAEVLNRFQQAVTVFGDATTASTAALREIQTDSAVKQQQMVKVLEDQTKRFTFFAGVAIAAALLVAVLGLAAAWAR